MIRAQVCKYCKTISKCGRLDMNFDGR